MPGHVAKHYLTLSVEELIEDVLRHYRVNVWPKVEEIIGTRLEDSSTIGIVLEGSAIWPEFVADLDFEDIGALWLTADDEVLRKRIYSGSLYSSKSSRERKMIEKFLERTLTYNALMIAAVNRKPLYLTVRPLCISDIWAGSCFSTTELIRDLQTLRASPEL